MFKNFLASLVLFGLLAAPAANAAILGVGYITAVNLGSTDPTKVDVTLTVVGIAPGQSLGAQTITLTNQSATVTGTTFDQAIKSAVKSYLTNTWGYSFGLLDDVVLVGATLL